MSLEKKTHEFQHTDYVGLRLVLFLLKCALIKA
jgi:hypothetical protein